MDEFLTFVASVFGVDAAELSADTAYGSIPQWDSLMQLRLIGELEDEYDVEIPLEKIPDIKTLADLHGFLTDQ